MNMEANIIGTKNNNISNSSPIIGNENINGT